MTHRQLLNRITEIIEAANVPDAKTDAWRLFEDFGGMSRSTFFMRENDEVEDTGITNLLLEKAELRAKRIPLQYITGKQEFCGCDLEVGKDTLVPRFDTEILCEEAVKAGNGKKVLDLCTGTGCIIIALSKMTQPALAVGTDISEGAICLAKRNAERNGAENVSFFSGDLFEALCGTAYENTGFDLIVSNPPYISASEMETLEPEVGMYEPRTALFGGEDGLDFYKRIVRDAAGHMHESGKIMFEIGCGQGEAVRSILLDGGFCDVTIKKDYAGLDRVIIGTKGKKDV